MLLGELAAGDLTLPANLAGVVISGLSSDSRAVKPGFLFAALPGSVADGGSYAGDAIARGAVAVLAGLDAAIEVPADIAVVRSDDPRRALARFAARFYPAQPAHMVAITGTSGKTSVAEFARQIFQTAGHKSASLGTLGVVTGQVSRKGSLTTPETVALHAEISRLARDGVTHLAIEASSHGLDQRRLDGLRITAAAFTNLGRDHLDYHRDEDDYMAAKLRLFQDILPADGTAIVDMDGPRAGQVRDAAVRRGQRVLTVGRAGDDIVLRNLRADGFGQSIEIDVFGKMYRLTIPLAGSFQVSNALVAAGLAIAVGVDGDVAIGALEQLKGAPGRLELIGRKANGAMVFVDYAHKPDALTQVLAALRPMARNRLAVL
ncbi:MAG: Mur ligase family protein, partial [Alphaproteobacteria bacterium]